MKILTLTFTLLALLTACNQASSDKNAEAETIATEEVATPKEFSEQMLADIEIIESYLMINDLEAEKTASGLHYIITEKGTGVKPQKGQTVSVHYKGTLTDDSQFDSSFDRGYPLDFKVGTGMVINGWDEGIALLNVGSKAKLFIPSELAYGKKEIKDLIPAHSVLIFDVELVNVK